MEISNSTSYSENPQLQASETVIQVKNISRRELMKLSLEERRCILAAQAELMLLHLKIVGLQLLLLTFFSFHQLTY